MTPYTPYFDTSQPLLLDWQREEVWHWLADGGFDTSKFELVDDGSVDHRGRLATLSMLATSHYFTFHESDDDWFAVMSPGQDTRELTTRPGRWGDVIRSAFVLWMGSLDRELNARDPWADVAQQRLLTASPTADDSNAPFTADEQRAIVERLRELDKRAAKDLPQPEYLVLSAQIADLEEAVARLGRRDWKGKALGLFFTLSVGAVLSPEVIRSYFFLLFRGVEHIFGLPSIPPELLA